MDGREKEKKPVWTRDLRRSVEGRGRGQGPGVNKMNTAGTFRSLHDRDFKEGKQGI